MITMNKLKERATVLPVIAFILLTPPILMVFNSAQLIWGIPVLYIYTFLIWGLLIAAGFFLTRALQRTEQRRLERLGQENQQNKAAPNQQLR